MWPRIPGNHVTDILIFHFKPALSREKGYILPSKFVSHTWTVLIERNKTNGIYEEHLMSKTVSTQTHPRPNEEKKCN